MPRISSYLEQISTWVTGNNDIFFTNFIEEVNTFCRPFALFIKIRTISVKDFGEIFLGNYKF